MSYIARLAARNAAVSPEVSPSAPVVPALRTDSPLAAFDQRYNLPGFAALPTAASFGSFEGAEDIGIEEDVPSFGADPSGVPERTAPPPSALGADVPRDPVDEHRRSAGSTTSVAAVSRAVAPLASEHRVPGPSTLERSTTHEIVTVTAPAVPPFGSPPQAPQAAQTGLRPPESAAPRFARERGVQAEPRALATRQSAPPGAERKPRNAEGPSQGVPPGLNEALPASLREALARVESWMKEPSQAGQESSRLHGATPNARAVSRAVLQAAIPEAPPRLAIGHLDIHVVTTPAPAPTQPRRAPRVATAPSGPRPSSNWGRLSFGVRQR